MYALILSFQNLMGFVILLRKWLSLKKKCGISISLLISEFDINLTSCDSHCRNDIFSYEDFEKSIA